MKKHSKGAKGAKGQKVPERFPVRISISGTRWSDMGKLSGEELKQVRDFFVGVLQTDSGVQQDILDNGGWGMSFYIPDGTNPPIEGMPVPAGGCEYHVDIYLAEDVQPRCEKA